MRLGQQKGGVVGRGSACKPGYRQLVVRFEEDLLEECRRKAERDGTSLGEAIRTLIVWGLESEDNRA